MKYYLSLSRLAEEFKYKDGYKIPYLNNCNLIIKNRKDYNDYSIIVSDENKIMFVADLNKLEIVNGDKGHISSLISFLKSEYNNNFEMNYMDLILSIFSVIMDNRVVFPLQNTLCDSFNNRINKSDDLYNYISKKDGICVSGNYDLDGTFVFQFFNHCVVREPTCRIIRFDKSIDIELNFITMKIKRTKYNDFDSKLFNEMIDKAKWLFKQPSINGYESTILYDMILRYDANVKRKYWIINYLKDRDVYINKELKDYIDLWKKTL